MNKPFKDNQFNLALAKLNYLGYCSSVLKEFNHNYEFNVLTPNQITVIDTILETELR